ncbi:NUDIX hydrolase [Candidatus Finniella inopinata]|uniref:NUDIX hydrolase n=1 Tax=Candidatus Finniella inopinata TaxID=1696036 RepID=A0A4V2DZW8_9PROT|nr:NUDIX hydrolase [Candidatus Finniella inopinata]RZI46507.1 NUDIX hydrolase [Candidatus Finniella inopinata]
MTLIISLTGGLGSQTASSSAKTSPSDGLKQYRVIGVPQDGGNKAVFILEDANHKKFILKLLEPNRLKEEILAGRLYKALGVDVPKNQAFRISQEQLPNGTGALNDELARKFQDLKDTDQKVLISLSDFIEGPKLSEVLPIQTLRAATSLKDLSPIQQQILIEINKGFVADCFLGNWDITVGFKNMIIAPDGHVYRFDNGGSLRYRAMGERKRLADLQTVGEIENLRDPTRNRSGSELYKFITDQEVHLQISKILSKKDKLWQEFSDLKKEISWPEPDERELKSILIQRLGSIAAYSLGTLFPKSIDENPRYTVSDADGIATPYTAAGMLNYMERDGEFYVLLGKRRGHDYWGNFGGGSEPTKEHTLLETAAREVLEESLGTFNISVQDLRRFPSHDMVSKQKEADLRPQFSGDNRVVLFRLYMVPGPYVASVPLQEKLSSEAVREKREYTEFMWVNLKSLLGNVCQPGLSKGPENNSIILKNVQTLDKGTQTFELHCALHPKNWTQS